MKFKVIKSKRVAPNDFSNGVGCDFCDDFMTHAVEIPDTPKLAFKGLCKGRNKRICKTCLDLMIQAIDKDMVDNFQADFEASRQGGAE